MEDNSIIVEEVVSRPKLRAKGVDVFYGNHHVIKDVNLDIKPNTVTSFIGPSGCGKSTFLRLYNRMNDYIEIFRMKVRTYTIKI